MKTVLGCSGISWTSLQTDNHINTSCRSYALPTPNQQCQSTEKEEEKEEEEEGHCWAIIEPLSLCDVAKSLPQ